MRKKVEIDEKKKVIVEVMREIERKINIVRESYIENGWERKKSKWRERKNRIEG